MEYENAEIDKLRLRLKCRGINMDDVIENARKQARQPKEDT